MIPSVPQPKYREVYSLIRDGILSESLAPGQRLSSSRALARSLGVARTTVEQAFDQLVLEGLIRRHTGRGTFVADHVPRLPHEVAPFPVVPDATRSLSQRGEAVLMAGMALTEEAPRGFAPCLPGRDTFPMHLWNTLANQQAKRHGRELVGGSDIVGLPVLREAIVGHLRTTRGVRATPEQVIVLSSTQQALDLAARLLLDSGDVCWLEDPGYLGARSAFLAAGLSIVAIPTDGQGLQVEEGVRLAPHARLVFVTPSHQYPLGVTMSPSRRAALLAWAREANAWVFEDDYDSEFRYDGRPLAALQGLDPERVLYAGSFNKVLFPGVRLAYLVVPRSLVPAMTAARRVTDGPAPALTQATLAAFMTSGTFSSHLHRLRGVYRARRDTLVEAAQHFPTWTEVPIPDAGMHAVIRFRKNVDDQQVSEAARLQHLDVPPLSRYAISSDSGLQGLVVGFGAVSPERITHGMAALNVLLRQHMAD